MQKVHSLQLPATYPAAAEEIDRRATGEADYLQPTANRSAPPERPSDPIIVDSQMQREYDRSEIIEEDLSLANAERELIRKALKKHNGRRREAAGELGISERTLYRKIKEYEVG
jgi:DNA-binding NtrC family response regulator